MALRSSTRGIEIEPGPGFFATRVEDGGSAVTVRKSELRAKRAVSTACVDVPKDGNSDIVIEAVRIPEMILRLVVV